LDVVMFVLCLLGVWAQRRGLSVRLGGYALFSLCAAAKFYPAALLILALRERRKVLLVLMGLGALVGLVVAVPLWHGVVASLAAIPSGSPFRATFGRIDLPRGLVMLGWLPRMPGLGRAGTASLVSWLLALGALAWAWQRLGTWVRPLVRLPEAERLLLIAASAAYALCFLAAQNVEYRALFLLPALPALLRLERRALVGAILLLLWEAVPRALIGGLTGQPYLPIPALTCFWLLREGVSWWIFGEFAAITIAFARGEAKRLWAG
jgi:hypothetical protein